VYVTNVHTASSFKQAYNVKHKELLEKTAQEVSSRVL
jgi:hypothetical protein